LACAGGAEVLERAVEVVAILAQQAADREHLGMPACIRVPGAQRRVGVSDVARITLFHGEIEVPARELYCRCGVGGGRRDRRAQLPQLGGDRIRRAQRQPFQHLPVVLGDVRCAAAASVAESSARASLIRIKSLYINNIIQLSTGCKVVRF
jgi:hypothetical protein